MQVTWDLFLRCVQEIVKLSDELHDGWHIQESQEEFATYITKKKFVQSNKSSELITIEYHVVFGVSYSTPKLCLNAWHQNGSLLSMEECWKCLDFSDNEDMYATLTQMDHPVLMRPFLTLHPCRTAGILETFNDSENPVVSWLSAVSAAVRLDFKLDYAQLTI